MKTLLGPQFRPEEFMRPFRQGIEGCNGEKRGGMLLEDDRSFGACNTVMIVLENSCRCGQIYVTSGGKSSVLLWLESSK